MSALENRENLFRLPLWLISLARILSRGRTGQNHFAARASRDALRKRIVRIQDRLFRAAPTASASAPFSSAILSREPMNSMCATPMFVMMATSGAASFAKRRNLAGMVHADLPDSDFIPRRGLAESFGASRHDY